MPKVLLRCDQCKGFHAAYLVDDPQLGRLRLCYRCWHARQSARPPGPPEQQPDAPAAAPTEQQPAQEGRLKVTPRR